MRKYIRGTFELDLNIADIKEYESGKKDFLENVINWADNIQMEIVLGTSDDGTYLCEFGIKEDTISLCNSYVSTLKSMLKSEFPKLKVLYQEKGNCMF